MTNNLEELKKQRKKLEQEIQELEKIEKISEEYEKAKSFVRELNSICKFYQIEFISFNEATKVVNAEIKNEHFSKVFHISISGTVKDAIGNIYRNLFGNLIEYQTFEIGSRAYLNCSFSFSGVSISVCYRLGDDNSKIPLADGDVELLLVEHDYSSYPTLDIVLCKNVSPEKAAEAIKEFAANPKVTVTIDFSL